ncbi:hypothetical protein TNCV_2391181 [Trichonephila clavipes]|nr:hypothetical protein TNCV_2391181 [Trichonephila clavipes]
MLLLKFYVAHIKREYNRSQRPRKPTEDGLDLRASVRGIRELIPLKTCHVEGLMHVKFIMTQSPPGELMRECQLKYRLRHLTVV